MVRFGGSRLVYEGKEVKPGDDLKLPTEVDANADFKMDPLPNNVGKLKKRLKEEGWKPDRQRGSHVQYRHPDNPNVVTVAGTNSDTIPRGTLGSIRRAMEGKR